ncbi:MAG: glycoside hydrolase family 127 protein [Phycisphaerales bacterium]|nr:glycoside hydrolase family 127 protein [Phycisphaerales bacterium]
MHHAHPATTPAVVLLSVAGLLTGVSAQPQDPAGAPTQPQAEGAFALLQPFDRADVHLTGGPLGDQAAEARAFFLALDEDNLLHGFRTRDGAAAPGGPMGGWYDPEDFAGAHPFGQWVSALARYYADTGDPAFKEKVGRLVSGFHASFRDDGFFYASQKAFDDWGCYIYDKNCTGMRDAYQLAGCDEALDVLREMTDWAAAHLDRRHDEWYTLDENLYRCAALTGEQRYLDLAREFDATEYYWSDMAKGENALHTDRHAYSHVNSLVSACQAYESTGDRLYLAAARNGWAWLARTQTYASGGWGPNERFVDPEGNELESMLTSTKSHFETICGSYASVNLDRNLIRYTGQAGYGDHMERILLNGVLGALPMQPDGRTFYYSDYSPGAQKRYFRDRWPCCAGTFAQITADYPLDVYLHGENELAVNLYTPSRLVWQRASGEVRIEQTTGFPFDDHVTLSVSTDGPQDFVLLLRLPGWARDGIRASVDGQPVPLAPPKRGYLPVYFGWDKQNTVEVDLPKHLHWEPISREGSDLAALMCGPVMLVALADGEVSFGHAEEDPETWIHPVEGSPLHFRAEPEGIEFRPFFELTDERYTTYCRLGPPPDAAR